MRLSLDTLQALAILIDVRERLIALAEEDELVHQANFDAIPPDDLREGWPAIWAAKELDKVFQLITPLASTPAPPEDTEQ